VGVARKDISSLSSVFSVLTAVAIVLFFISIILPNDKLSEDCRARLVAKSKVCAED
jgi:hypothetical protein